MRVARCFVSPRRAKLVHTRVSVEVDDIVLMHEGQHIRVNARRGAAFLGNFEEIRKMRTK